MIPKEFVPDREITIKILAAIKNELMILRTENIRFFIVRLTKNELTCTLHKCCEPINESFAEQMRKAITGKVIGNTSIGKVIWE